MLAGIDRREQKKQSAAVEADMIRKLREGAGITETAAMRLEAQERKDRADKYGAGDMRVSVWHKGTYLHLNCTGYVPVRLHHQMGRHDPFLR